MEIIKFTDYLKGKNNYGLNQCAVTEMLLKILVTLSSLYFEFIIVIPFSQRSYRQSFLIRKHLEIQKQSESLEMEKWN